MDACSKDTRQLQVRESVSSGSPGAGMLQQALEGERSSNRRSSSRSTAESINNEGAAQMGSGPVFAKQMGHVRVRPGKKLICEAINGEFRGGDRTMCVKHMLHLKTVNLCVDRKALISPAVWLLHVFCMLYVCVCMSECV